MGLERYGIVHRPAEVGSTNDYALGLASQRANAVVIAERQSQGRGRFGRPWFSDEDSLTASLLLSSADSGFALRAALGPLAGLALARAIGQVTGLQALTRWPNDIVHADRKVAGLLCEARGGAVVVGVGVNVNQTSLPGELADAGSLRPATGRSWDKLVLLEQFLYELFAIKERFERGDSARLVSEMKACSAVLERRVSLATRTGSQVGTVVDLDVLGRVVLRTESGQLLALAAGEVTWLR